LFNLHRGPSDALDNGAHGSVSVSVSDGHPARGALWPQLAL